MVGVDVGDEEGERDSMVVGDALGKGVEAREGAVVGPCEGCTVVVEVGARNGEWLGLAVEAKLGLAVGPAVGKRRRWAVGDCRGGAPLLRRTASSGPCCCTLPGCCFLPCCCCSHGGVRSQLKVTPRLGR